MQIRKFFILFIVQSQFLEAQNCIIGCYVPYWKTESATSTLKKHLYLFNQVSPFSLEVKSCGSLIDTFKNRHRYWQEIRERCKKYAIKCIPTIFWTNTAHMHSVLSNRKKREKHINQILSLITEHNYDGININYERVGTFDRESYMIFLEKLAHELHTRGLELHTSIGGRTSDNTIGALPDSLKYHPSWPNIPTKRITDEPFKKSKGTNVSLNPGSGVTAMRYKKLIARCCDQVNIMGYDEWGHPYHYDKEHLKNKYYASHSSAEWCEQILRYALSFIPAHKIVLGVPNYGLEFAVSHDADGKIKRKKRRNLGFHGMTKLAKNHRKKPKKTAGGELSFMYPNRRGEQRYVCYLDAHGIKDRINIAKKYGIKGLYIFTINGDEDPNLWHILAHEQKRL